MKISTGALVALMIFVTLPVAGFAGPRVRFEMPEAPLSDRPVEHPCLFFRAEDLEAIRRAAETVPAAGRAYERLVERTDPTRPVDLPVPGAPTQPDWRRVAGRMGGHAARCGVLYQLTGERRYADWARRMLLRWTETFDTHVDFRLAGDYHGTEVGHTGAGGNTMGYYYVGELLMNTALAYDCVYDTLTPEQRKTIEDGFFRRWVDVIESFEYSRRMPGNPDDYMHAGGQWNGANKCNMGLTATGFVLGDDRLIRRGIRNFKLYLSRDLLADGLWIEEDLGYSHLCLDTLFNIAWMARAAGYTEDLFTLTVEARPRDAYDRGYGRPARSDGPVPAARTLKMYLDAQLGYQLPTLGPGNWGWTPNRGSISSNRTLIGMFNVGWSVYGDPAYAFVLDRLDRTRSTLAPAMLDLLVHGRPLREAVDPPTAESRWYRHGQWVVLRSVRGRDYWGSDALYAFLSYSTGRSKGIQALSLEVFGFGRSLAPRTAVRRIYQNLTKSYQLNEPAWNTVMVDGCNLDGFRGRTERAWMAYHDFGSLVNIAAPRVHWIGERQRELHTPNVERHPEEDRVMGRTLALADRYLVDVFHVSFDRPPACKHNLDYVLNGKGTLTVEGADRSTDQILTFTGDDGITLRSTILTAGPRGGTKVTAYTGPRGPFAVATRANYEDWFVVVHEPWRSERPLVAISALGDRDDAVALELRHADGTVDRLALRTKPTTTTHEWPAGDGEVLRLEGNAVFERIGPDGRRQVQRTE
ncbi:MAG: alginate lyase family protein [Planctomycetota bacterium]